MLLRQRNEPSTDNVWLRHTATHTLLHCFPTFFLQRNLPQMFGFLMEPYAMIQMSILLQRQWTVVARSVPANFGGTPGSNSRNSRAPRNLGWKTLRCGITSSLQLPPGYPLETFSFQTNLKSTQGVDWGVWSKVASQFRVEKFECVNSAHYWVILIIRTMTPGYWLFRNSGRFLTAWSTAKLISDYTSAKGYWK